MRAKHRRDKNHGKNGYVSGNPRFGKAKRTGRGKGSCDKADRAKSNAQARREMEDETC